MFGAGSFKFRIIFKFFDSVLRFDTFEWAFHIKRICVCAVFGSCARAFDTNNVVSYMIRLLLLLLLIPIRAKSEGSTRRHD